MFTIVTMHENPIKSRQPASTEIVTFFWWYVKMGRTHGLPHGNKCAHNKIKNVHTNILAWENERRHEPRYDNIPIRILQIQ